MREDPIQIMRGLSSLPPFQGQVPLGVVVLAHHLLCLVLGQPVVFLVMNDAGTVQTSFLKRRFLGRIPQDHRYERETMLRGQVEEFPHPLHVPAMNAVGDQVVNAQRPGGYRGGLGSQDGINAGKVKTVHVVGEEGIPQVLREGFHAVVVHAVEKHAASLVGTYLLHFLPVLDHHDGVVLHIRGVRRSDAGLQDRLERGLRYLLVEEVAVDRPQAPDGLERLIGWLSRLCSSGLRFLLRHRRFWIRPPKKDAASEQCPLLQEGASIVGFLVHRYHLQYYCLHKLPVHNLFAQYFFNIHQI